MVCVVGWSHLFIRNCRPLCLRVHELSTETQALKEQAQAVVDSLEVDEDCQGRGGGGVAHSRDFEFRSLCYHENSFVHSV